MMSTRARCGMTLPLGAFLPLTAMPSSSSDGRNTRSPRLFCNIQLLHMATINQIEACWNKLIPQAWAAATLACARLGLARPRLRQHAQPRATAETRRCGSDYAKSHTCLRFIR